MDWLTIIGLTFGYIMDVYAIGLSSIFVIFLLFTFFHGNRWTSIPICYIWVIEKILKREVKPNGR